MIPKIKEIRAKSGLTQVEFANQYNIPLHTLQGWECGKPMKDYVALMLNRIVTEDMENEE